MGDQTLTSTDNPPPHSPPRLPRFPPLFRSLPPIWIEVGGRDPKPMRPVAPPTAGRLILLRRTAASPPRIRLHPFVAADPDPVAPIARPDSVATHRHLTDAARAAPPSPASSTSLLRGSGRGQSTPPMPCADAGPPRRSHPANRRRRRRLPVYVARPHPPPRHPPRARGPPRPAHCEPPSPLPFSVSPVGHRGRAPPGAPTARANPLAGAPWPWTHAPVEPSRSRPRSSSRLAW